MNEGAIDRKEIRMANPPDRAYLAMMLLVSSFGFTLGLISYFEDERDVFACGILFFFASLITYAILYRELIHRPKSIGISDGGVFFHYHFNSKEIRWDMIKSIYCRDSDPERSFMFFERRGGMMMKGGHALYSLSYEAARTIRERTGITLDTIRPSNDPSV